jgi:hypothetical protein
MLAVRLCSWNHYLLPRDTATLLQNDAFVFYSNYTETQLLPGARLLVEQMAAPEFDKQYVYKKYTNKKVLRASTFARDWARTHVAEDGQFLFHCHVNRISIDKVPSSRSSHLLSLVVPLRLAAASSP